MNPCKFPASAIIPTKPQVWTDHLNRFMLFRASQLRYRGPNTCQDLKAANFLTGFPSHLQATNLPPLKRLRRATVPQFLG